MPPFLAGTLSVIHVTRGDMEALGAMIVALICAVLPGTLAARRADKRAVENAHLSEAIHKAIGQPNGRGNMVEMAERILEVQETVAAGQARFETRMGHLQADLGELMAWRPVHDEADNAVHALATSTAEDVAKIKAKLGIKAEDV